MIKRRRISFQRPTFDKATGGLIGGARGRTLDWFRDMDENREQIQENSRETIKSEESKEEESHKKNIPKGCWLEGA